jgi:hypothetical protein
MMSSNINIVKLSENFMTQATIRFRTMVSFRGRVLMTLSQIKLKGTLSGR